MTRTHHRGPIDNRPPPGQSLARVRVTGPAESVTLLLVGKSWPVEEFNKFLEARMKIVGIRDRAELARLAEIDQTQLSNWRLGKTQPSKESLKKVARPLGVRPVVLYLAAGLMTADELDLETQPALVALPPELDELVNLYSDEALNNEERELLLSQARGISLGIRAMAAVRRANEPARRRAATNA